MKWSLYEVLPLPHEIPVPPVPVPPVPFIHGGGFTGGDKSKWRQSGEIGRLVNNGLSCAAINYRFRKDAPIQEILLDAARAVQTLRARAGEWNLDKDRFAGFGGSAGAGTSLWLLSRMAEVAAGTLAAGTLAAGTLAAGTSGRRDR